MRYYEIAIVGRPLILTYVTDIALELGSIVEVPIKSRLYEGAVIREVEKPSFECEKISFKTDCYYSLHQLQLAKFISSYYVASLGETLALFVPFSNKSVDTLQLPKIESVTLSSKQLEALTFAKAKKHSLLFGDTGSGKTQIYMAWIKEIVESGKQAVFLMPEISLTPQMQKRLEKVFGGSVVIWHSKLSKKKKERALEKIYNGEARVVAGPRSALFLPLKDLGLIVVDEEHDDSYKSQSRPRIHARDVALYMGKKFDIPVLLGSATPSVTSFYKLPTFRLKGSFHGGEKNFVFDESSGLTPAIVSAISQVLNQKKQALIFLPTRANFKYLVCQSCGEIIKCPYCEVGMSVHFDKHALVCHYCNFKEYIPKRCQVCQQEMLATQRVGTAQLQQELQLEFPKAIVERFDKDSVSTQKKLEKLIKAFSKKEIDILVGTQMLSKGHDYPDVALSIIMDIDYVLAMADFRASERAAALCVQIAGRAGRKENATVIIQTHNRAFFERYLDYEKFLLDELQFRKDLYPPFVKLAQLNFAHKKREKAESAMRDVYTKLLQFEGIEIVGFGPNAIEKIANKYRFHILLRSKSVKKLLEAIYASKNELCEVDMDPVQVG